MASSVKIVCTKNCLNLLLIFKVTIVNVKDAFCRIFLFISTHISLVLFFSGSAKADIG